ncbi:MAG: hypothetical protein WCF94_00430 [bacterium]
MFGYKNVTVVIFLAISGGKDTILYSSEAREINEGETTLPLACHMLDEIGINHTIFRPHLQKTSFGSETAEYFVRFSDEEEIPQEFYAFLSNLSQNETP